MLARPWEAWLDTVWNAVDTDRVKQVGTATVAAQWMLRLGGSVQLGDKRWLTDYNSLPASPAIQVSGFNIVFPACSLSFPLNCFLI